METSINNMVYDVTKLQANAFQSPLSSNQASQKINVQSQSVMKEKLRVNINESPDEIKFNMDGLFPSNLLNDTDRSMIKISKVTTRNPSEGKLSDN